FVGGVDVAQSMEEANAETLIIAQIESAPGVEQVEEIAAVAGIDVLWIGHLDLTVSLGIPGRYRHPDFTGAVARVLAAAQAAGKAAAVKVGTVDEGRQRLGEGFRCICYGDDVRLVRESLRVAVDALRSV
ncbi:MAG: aldolase/citrate lyase family protein, partial [Egibacteraceae bacterium]